MKTKTLIIPRYAETDKMGIIHHSVYTIWFEQGRIDWCEKMDFPFHKIEELGIMLPVLSINLEYKKPAKFGECLTLFTELKSYSKVKLEYYYELYDTVNNLLNKGTTTHCWLNSDFQPINIAKTHPEVFAMVESSVK